MCALLASRPLNNLKYTEHLTEMRQRWLTDTSISPAICLTEGGERSRVPHAWRREHRLLVRGDIDRDKGGEKWDWRREREIASSQFRFDEGHSVSSGWAQIYVTLAWLRLQKHKLKMCCDFKWSAHAIPHWYRAGLSYGIGSYIPFMIKCKTSVMSANCGWSVEILPVQKVLNLTKIKEANI